MIPIFIVDSVVNVLYMVKRLVLEVQTESTKHSANIMYQISDLCLDSLEVFELVPNFILSD